MKIAKGSWIGLLVAILWMAGIAWGMQHCNWNWVCNGAVKPGFCSSDLAGWIFIIPILTIESLVFWMLKPFGTVSGPVVLIIATLVLMILGLLLGACVETLVKRLQRK